MSSKRRIAAAILCACFVLRLTSYAVSRDGIYFVALENMMAPLTEDSMPFWNDGYLYISADIFTDSLRDALGISRAKIGDGVLLYRGEQSLLFREGRPYAQDSQEETYAPGMVWHNGGAYVPASVVARYFNLTYSTVSVKYGHLVWLRSAAFKMDDKAFAKAAEFQMNAAYQEYLRSPEPEEEPETPPEEEPEIWGEFEAFPEPDAEGAEPDAFSASAAEPVAPSAPTTTKPAAPDTSEPTERVAPPAPTTTKPAAPSAPTTTKPAAPSAPTTTKPAAPSAPTTTKPVAPSAPTTTKPAAPPAPTTTETVPATTAEPVAPTTEPVAPPAPADNMDDAPVIGGGQRIYLCLRGDADASALLDALDRRNIRAAVFCDETFLSEQGDLLRRMAATGHQIGLYVAAGPSAPSVLEELEERNEQLRRVTMEKTRLVYADGGGEQLLRALEGSGYLCLRPTLDRSEFPLRTSRQASDLLAAVSQQSSESVAVWLGGTVSRSGLNAFINDALEVGDAFPVPYEAAFFWLPVKS